MTITTQTATTYQDIDSGSTLISVPWEILNDDASVAHSGVQSFSLTATADDVSAFLSQALTTYQEDVARNAASAALQADLDNAASVVAAISNLSISQ